MTVLIVDDDAAVRSQIVEILEQDGFQAVVAESGRQAMRLLRRKSFRPCLVLLEAFMSEMDGWEVLRLRALNPRIAAIPFAIMSAQAYAREIARRNFGRSIPLIEKPIVEARLLEVVEEYCKRVPG